jgi:catechol 2,3-dioxygenase-like lactoylglutathione lyase family enzyme
MQIDHVAIPVADLATARAFYEQALAPLGVQVLAERSSAMILFGGGQGDGMFALRQGTDYRTPVHVAFSTDRAGGTPSTRLRSRRAALTTAPPGTARQSTAGTTTPPTSAIRTGTTSKRCAAWPRSRNLLTVRRAERG